MKNNEDTHLKLLQKGSDGESESGADQPNLNLAALAVAMNQIELKSAWNARQRESVLTGNVDVFMVEDDPSMINLVRALLKAEGIGLLAVESFHEAMVALRQTHPRLLLVDLGLPDGSGLEIARTVRDWRYFPRIPVVALTANSEKAGAAWLAGFSGFIPKPFVATTFQNMITSLLSAPPTRNQGIDR